MASPKLIVFFLYDASTGGPLVGVTPTFTTYKDDLGADILPKPTITEIGGGAYKFAPDLSNTSRGIVYLIDGTVAASPRRLSGFVRPEDFALDLVQDLWDMEFGKWQIVTSGGDNNRLVTYKSDGTTILKKFNLFDSAGVPTTTNPYRRDPV